ncbi:hypothetical protein RVS70_09245 [Virgibacillus sp. M23]|uniref:hypothetical protein n=1 Tax=Virgibacillus sp. M23 TaxID=3079030 RepID=UPI002A917D65|nr:hypothetical protein [Virgibacillus sp. M23]MDY7044389.1 hypothetical protein [Virgibacillus sp. M23]
MKKTIFLAIGWILVVLFVLIIVIQNPTPFFVNGTIILGWLLFMLQLTWTHSEYFYMVIKKVWFTIKNPDCIWKMQVEYSGDFEEDIVEKVDKVFNMQNQELKQINLSSSRRLYKVGTLSFELVVENNKKIRLQLEDLEISYRRSKKIIDEELSVLLEQLSRSIKEDHCEYYFNINFKEFNPYYGFFIRRLNSKDINTFSIKFNIENDKVTINKKSIDVHTTSLQKLNSFSKTYLSLSPR